MSTASATSSSPTGAPLLLRFPSPEKQSEARSTMTAPKQLSTHAPITIPMGFSGQLRTLHDTQREQADRIATLERENAELKAIKDITNDLITRIDALEQHNLHLAARRRECVSQLLNLQPLHQEASNAFHLRSQDIQPDDLEGMLPVYANSITTTMNHQQRALGQFRTNGYAMPVYGAPCPQVAAPFRSQFPMAYTEAGYCRAHQVPYWCRICGQ